MAVNNYDGIGFLVGNDICVVDLDDCSDSTSKLKPTVQNVVDDFEGCLTFLYFQSKGVRISNCFYNYNKDKCKEYNKKLVINETLKYLNKQQTMRKIIWDMK